jgi:hypothetical protein
MPMHLRHGHEIKVHIDHLSLLHCEAGTMEAEGIDFEKFLRGAVHGVNVVSRGIVPSCDGPATVSTFIPSVTELSFC